MKKTIYSLAMIFSLTACSLNDVASLLITPTALPTPVETSTPTVFSTPTQTPTITPVPSFTSTPTLAGAGNAFEEEPTDTTPLPTLVLIPTATSGPQTSLFSEPGALIQSISVSSDILFWGYCDAPKYVDFDVRLANNLRVTYVLLFLRLVDKNGNQSTAWGGGAIMKKVTGSYYTYRITPDKLSYYEEFKDAWVEYQVIAATGSLKHLGSSPVYQDTLSLQWCQPAGTGE
jgi:hypothetical protein